MQRAGELLLELKADKGGRPSKTSSPRGRGFRQQAAAAAGLTPKQAKTAVEVARVEAQLADEMMEASPPASLSELAAAGRQARREPVDLRYALGHLVLLFRLGFRVSRVWGFVTGCSATRDGVTN